ncbi:MAG: hypothetical protein LBU11_06220 [Zoogloeaceae bacterium]|jgi:hypothetical protein|nr:hypothetical protein [Zoogloeaceae bacterium]
MKNRPFPPTLPEFINDCRAAEAWFPEYGRKNEAPPPERSRERAEQLERAVKEIGKGQPDPLAWAKHVKSQAAVRLMRDGMQRGNQRLSRIYAVHVQNGVISANGKLLKAAA